MRALGQTALAVTVITGWFLALTWLALSVSQLAVEHTVVRPCASTTGGPGCWR